jgi:DNA polymerase III delta subunit
MKNNTHEKAIYLLLGSELGEKERFINQLRTVTEAKHGTVEFYKFYSHEMDMGELCLTLMTPALFAGTPFVVLAHLEALKKADLNTLLGALIHLPEQAVLICTSNEEIPPRIDKRLDELIPHKNKRTFKKLSTQQLLSYIAHSFENAHYHCDADVPLLLLDLVDGDTQALDKAIESLLEACSETKEISLAAVEELIDHNKEENAQTLFKRLVQHDLVGALDVALQLSYSKEGLGVQTMQVLQWHFRTLLEVKERIKSGENLSTALRNARLFYDRADLFREANERFNLGEVQHILGFSSRYDLALRACKKEMTIPLMASYAVAICKQRPPLV